MKRKKLLSFILALLILTQIIPNYAIEIDIGTDIIEESRVMDESIESEELEDEAMEEMLESNLSMEENYNMNEEDIYIIDKDRNIGEQMIEASINHQTILFTNMFLENEFIEVLEGMNVIFDNVKFYSSSIKSSRGNLLILKDVEMGGSFNGAPTIDIDNGYINMNEVTILDSIQPIKIVSNSYKSINITNLTLENNVNDGALIELSSIDDYVFLNLENIVLKNNKNNYIEGSNVKFNIDGLRIEDKYINEESERLGLFFKNTVDDVKLKEMESRVTGYTVDVNQAPLHFNEFERQVLTFDDFKFTGESKEILDSSFDVKESEISFTNGEFKNIASLSINNLKDISDLENLNLIYNVKFLDSQVSDTLIEVVDDKNEDMVKKFTIEELIIEGNTLTGYNPNLLRCSIKSDLEIKNSKVNNNRTEEHTGFIDLIYLESAIYDFLPKMIIRNVSINKNVNLKSAIKSDGVDLEILDTEIVGNTGIISNSYYGGLIELQGYNELPKCFLNNVRIEKNIIDHDYNNTNMIYLVFIDHTEAKIQNIDIIENDIYGGLCLLDGILDLDSAYIYKNSLLYLFDLNISVANNEKVNIKNPKIIENEIVDVFGGYDVEIDIINGTIVNNIIEGLKSAREITEGKFVLNFKNTIIYNNNDIKNESKDFKKLYDLLSNKYEYFELKEPLYDLANLIQKDINDKFLYYEIEDIDGLVEKLERLESLILDIETNELSEVLEQIRQIDDYLMGIKRLENKLDLKTEEVSMMLKKIDYIKRFGIYNSKPGNLVNEYFEKYQKYIIEKYGQEGEYIFKTMYERFYRKEDRETINFYNSLFNNNFHEDFNTIEKCGQNISNNIVDIPLLDENYIPLEGSVVINKGNNDYITEDMAYDFIGRDSENRSRRIVNGTVDIGAYEYQGEVENLEIEIEDNEDKGKPITPSLPDNKDHGTPIDPDIPKKPIISEDHTAYIEGYKDNTVRPNAKVSREEISAMLFRLLDGDYREKIKSNNNNFNDVNSTRWSNKYISTLANGDLLLGYPDKTFRPVDSLTRAEAAVLIYRFGQVELDEKDKIKDVKLNDISGHWAEEDIKGAVKRGWIDGYPDGSFRPNQNITRAEMVTLINRMLNRHTRKENMFVDRNVYKDLSEKEWYYEAFEEAVNGHKYERLVDDSEKWIEKIDTIEM